MSEIGDFEMIEREYADEGLRNANREMKMLLQRVVLKYSKFDKTISTLDCDMVAVVAKMEEWITEDMGGAFATLAAKYVALKGNPHYSQWRE